ncbi:MrcB family domain-containing protein [Salinispora vitiensis]|uniref:MrcB family domain-containing protein n=1 Tax=Salinispora vitiensis TaxID=999544 RepID=UPI0009B7E06C|nr:DUF3578 domain-containing protein [Salinispora vitiensis]
MDLGEALAGVRLKAYAHTNGREQPAQQHLEAVRGELSKLVPLGMSVRVSGSGQSLPLVPWIAVLDKDVTTTAQEGLYVVYLYRRDLSCVYLSMNQGATQHKRNAVEAGLKGTAAEKAALAELDAESKLLRKHLGEETMAGLIDEIDLDAPKHFLPRGYEEGNIAALTYDPAQLPNEEMLRADLDRFYALYAMCVDIKREILATEPGVINTTPNSEKTKRKFRPRPPAFRPKNPSDYRAHVKKHFQDRKPRHEALVNAFAAQAKGAGMTVANNTHPCDLTVDGKVLHWLVEVKVVGPNAETVVREAIGQLFSYRHFCYRDIERPDPNLVALFSGPIGDAFVDLLVSLGIETIWRAGGDWCGRAPTGVPSLLAAVTPAASSV